MNEKKSTFIIKKNSSQAATCSLNRFTSDIRENDIRSYEGTMPSDHLEHQIGKRATYTVVSHPHNDYLPKNRLRTVDDLDTRLANKLTPVDYETSRVAIFQVSRNKNI